MPRPQLVRNHRRIAEVLAGERAVAASPAAKATVTAITYSIADIFAQSATTFDRDKFYQIAGQPPLK
jgi:hypothetical protein